MADMRHDDDWEVTYEKASPNDPILHGARWRRERDEALAEVKRLRKENADLRCIVRLWKRWARTPRTRA